MTYEQANKLLQGRCVDSRKVTNNTYLTRDNAKNCIHIKLHSTNVVTFQHNGDITLNAGGWRTVTTKDRMNKYLPAPWRIHQEKGVWFLACHGTRYPFADGITILADGNVQGADTTRYKMTAQLNKDIAKYASGYVNALFTGKVHAPDNGDCWFCLFKWSKDTEHYITHFKERYYVGSLLQNAIERFPGAFSQVAKHEISCCWYPENPNAKHFPESMRGVVKNQIKRALVKFLKAEFEIAGQ